VKTGSEDAVIPPPKAPDLDEEVAKQYALFRDLPYLVSPVNYLELGSTADTASAFNAAVWQRYLAATQYMAKVPVNFSMLQDFSKDSAALDQLVNELAPSANDAGAIAAWLDTGWKHITSLLVRFEQIGPKAFKNITPPATGRPGRATVAPSGGRARTIRSFASRSSSCACASWAGRSRMISRST
jgi:hypothetical protein